MADRLRLDMEIREKIKVRREAGRFSVGSSNSNSSTCSSNQAAAADVARNQEPLCPPALRSEEFFHHGWEGTAVDAAMEPEELAERMESRRHLQRGYSGLLGSPSSSPLPLPPRLWSSAPTSPRTTPWSSLHDPPAARAAGTSSSSPRDNGPSRTAAADEARSKQHPAKGPTRSDYVAMMRTALAKFQDDASAEDGEATAAASAVMEQAMTGLMDLTYRKAKPPELPYEFATRWPIPVDDDEVLQARIMSDPVILASGYSVDQSYHNYQKQHSPRTNTITDHSSPHTLSIPNHLLHDMISAWCLDHWDLSPPITPDEGSVPMDSTEKHIERILEKFSGNYASQIEALNQIQELSKTTKGVQPCLAKFPDLIPVLINLRKKYKSSWTRDLEEARLTVILNLTLHRQNREILAGRSELPGALKIIAQKAYSLGRPASSLAKVASVVAILSEFCVFRKRMLDTGGMKMLRDMLKMKDTVVITEAATAILALCTDYESKLSAQVYNVPEMLLKCHLFTDEILRLLDCVPRSPYVFKKICNQALQLVNIIMADHAFGPVTSKGIHSAISLVYDIVERDVGKMKVLKNMEDFKERLRQLSSDRMPMQTMFQVESIISTLSEVFPATTV
uniref:RING-type E3 ubiquitin transferase n=3 Tax=Oryza brachyantha TaxID=4533 RepID=J3LCY5_ORYBR